MLVHTGQHYDDELSRVFFDELGLPRPDHRLGVGGGTNTSQTARMLAALEPLLAAERPDVVLVYGDTNSTLAGALAGAQAGVPVAHVEAGMRSYDRTMPEELNRVLADHAAVAAAVLVRARGRDAAARAGRRARSWWSVTSWSTSRICWRRGRGRARLRSRRWGVESGGYLLVTAHRAGNVDDPARLARLVELLLAVPGPVVLPLHPRTRARLEAAGLLERLDGRVRLTPPLGYLDFTALLLHARAVLTDSGGVQKEAYLAGVPCLTLRTAPSGRRRSTPAGTRWSTSTRTPPWPRSSARCRPSGRRSTATAARASGWWRRCGRR